LRNTAAETEGTRSHELVACKSKLLHAITPVWLSTQTHTLTAARHVLY